MTLRLNWLAAALACLLAAGPLHAEQVIFTDTDDASFWSKIDKGATMSTIAVPVESATNMLFPVSAPGAWGWHSPDATGTSMTIENGAARMDMKQITSPDVWRYQIVQQNFVLKEGASYIVTFRAKADAARPISVSAQIVGGDWHSVGLSADAPLTTDWQNFSFPFVATSVGDNTLFTVNVGQKAGTVWVSDLVLKPASGQPGPNAPKAAIKIDITQDAANPYDVQYISKNLTVTNGSKYRITLMARAETIRQAFVSLRINHEDWHQVGKYEPAIMIGPSWRAFSFDVKADAADGDNNVLSVSVGGPKGVVLLSGVKVVKLD